MSTYSHLYPEKMAVMAEDLDRKARGGASALPDGSSLADVADRLEEAENRSGV